MRHLTLLIACIVMPCFSMIHNLTLLSQNLKTLTSILSTNQLINYTELEQDILAALINKTITNFDTKYAAPDAAVKTARFILGILLTKSTENYDKIGKLLWHGSANIQTRIMLIVKIIDYCIKHYKLDQKISFVTIGGGKLLQEYLIIRALLDAGFNHIIMYNIEPYKNKNAFLEKQLKLDGVISDTTTIQLDWFENYGQCIDTVKDPVSFAIMAAGSSHPIYSKQPYDKKEPKRNRFFDKTFGKEPSFFHSNFETPWYHFFNVIVIIPISGKSLFFYIPKDYQKSFAKIEKKQNDSMLASKFIERLNQALRNKEPWSLHGFFVNKNVTWEFPIGGWPTILSEIENILTNPEDLSGIFSYTLYQSGQLAFYDLRNSLFNDKSIGFDLLYNNIDEFEGKTAIPPACLRWDFDKNAQIMLLYNPKTKQFEPGMPNCS
jgi:hypothetical protein